MLNSGRFVENLVENQTQTLSIKDDAFDINNISEYTLNFLIQEASIQVCVVDYRAKRVLLLEDYRLGHETSQPVSGNVSFLLDSVFESNPYVHAGYWKNINIVFQNANFALVPKTLFDERYSREFLYINSATGDDYSYDVMHSYTEQNISNRKDIVSVFAVNKPVIGKIRERYGSKKINVLHHTTHLLRMPNYCMEKQEGVNVTVFDSEKFYTLCVWKGEQLLICNTYHYKTKEDFIYYILFACDQLDIKCVEARCHYFSNVYETTIYQNESLKLLHQYFPTVNLNTRPKGYYLSYHFDELQDYLYNDLFFV